VTRGYALALGALMTVVGATAGAAAVTPQRSIAHSAYGLQLSVPEFWAVAYFQACPIRTVGTLLIGTPTYASNCTLIPANANIVSMQLQQSGEIIPGPGKHLVIHGLGVTSYSTGARSSGGATWVVPSKHVVLMATGPRSFAVLHTLANATSRADPAPGMLRGSEYLIALIPTPVSGPVSVTRRSSRGTGSTTVRAFDAQFWDAFPPGNYLLRGHAGNAPCPPVGVTVQSGQTTDAPEIDCQGE